MRRYGLIGYPLTHSFSQKFFSEKFENLGLYDCVYSNFSLKEICELSPLLENQIDLYGLNITIPYKKKVLDYLTDASEIVEKIGACNCIHIHAGKISGYNTDVFGFEHSLLPYLQPHHTHALILGTGGASAAVEFVLEKLGIHFQFVSRKASEKSLSYHQVDKNMLSSHPLIINTTPLGMYPNPDFFPDIPYQYLTPDHHLFDMIYNPAETRFLEKGKLQGATTQNGMDMLVLQAEESWRIWNT